MGMSEEERLRRKRERNRVYMAKWAAENPEKVKAVREKHYAKNLESIRERDAKRYAENSDMYRERAAKWAAANPEKVKAMNAKYRSDPRVAAKTRIRGAKWAAANPGKVKAKNAKWRDKLSDAYISEKLRVPNPPLELIEAKREQLKMYRATKSLTQQLQQTIKENQQ